MMMSNRDVGGVPGGPGNESGDLQRFAQDTSIEEVAQ
jgi:hypothetical protein